MAKKSPVEAWNQGTLVLNNNEILKGKLFYNIEHDLVQIMINNQIKTFSPYNVQYFQFFDKDRGIKRLYAALKDNTKKGKKRERKGFAFFEVLVGTELVLLRKEEYYFIPEYEILYNAIDLVPSMASRHYIFINNNLFHFQDFKKDVFPLMADQKTLVKEYIYNNKLNVEDFVDQILIIDFYNSLKNPYYKMLTSELILKE